MILERIKALQAQRANIRPLGVPLPLINPTPEELEQMREYVRKGVLGYYETINSFSFFVKNEEKL